MLSDEAKEQDAGYGKRPTDNKLSDSVSASTRYHRAHKPKRDKLTIALAPRMVTSRPDRVLKIRALTPSGMKRTEV